MNTLIVTVRSARRVKAPPARQARPVRPELTALNADNRPRVRQRTRRRPYGARRRGQVQRARMGRSGSSPNAYIGRSAATDRRPCGEQVWDVSGHRDRPAPRSYLRSSATESERHWGRVSGPRHTAPTCSPLRRHVGEVRRAWQNTRSHGALSQTCFLRKNWSIDGSTPLSGTIRYTCICPCRTESGALPY